MLFRSVICILVIQILKNYFSLNDYQLYIEPGSNYFITEANSTQGLFFSPSMHTAIAFMISSCLILKYRLSSFTQIALFFTSFGVACSRVYLANNVVLELWVGFCIGCSSSLVVYFLETFSSKKYLHHKKYIKPNDWDLNFGV